MIKIALTGGIACGKSKVGQILQNLGLDVIRLDDLAREVVMPNTDGLGELVHVFGEQILNPDKSLNRQMLNEFLLKNKATQRQIEAILHPKIFSCMQLKIKSLQSKLVVVEIPLLNTNNITFFDRVLLVNCDNKTQLKRLMQREKISVEQAKISVAAQLQNLAFVTLPIDVLDNHSTLTELNKKVRSLHKKLINL